MLELAVFVFTIWGFISFIKWLFPATSTTSSDPEPKTTTTHFTEQAFIEQIKLIIKQNPDKTVSEIYQEYLQKNKEQLYNQVPLPPPKISPLQNNDAVLIQASQSDTYPVQGRIISETIIPPEQEQDFQKDTTQDIWQNWYSENSINLLLYIGAFFIVASASIFVGFQWESINGVLKASMLTLLTLAFLGSGLIFYKKEKIKNAGVIFAGIGALLIPFCGSAWFNFVFRDNTTSFGVVWLITSLTALSTYIFLAKYFRSKIYTYIASLSSLSILLACVKITGLNADYYILASMLGSFVLIFNASLIKSEDPETQDIFITPLKISANVSMPITLCFGLITALSTNKLFSLEAAASVGIAALYYFMLYYNFKKIEYLYATYLLYPFGVFLFSQWQSLSVTTTAYLFIIIAFLELVLAKYYRQQHKEKESALNLVASGIKIATGILPAFSPEIAPLHRCMLLVLTALSGVGYAYIKNNLYFLYISTLSLIAVTIIGVTSFIDPQYQRITMVMILTLGGMSLYLATRKQVYDHIYFNTLGGSVLIYLSLATIYALGNASLMAVVMTIITMIVIDAYQRWEKPLYVYTSGLTGLIAILNYINAYIGTDLIQSVSVYTCLIIGTSIYTAATYYKNTKHANGLIVNSILFLATPLLIAIPNPLLMGIVALIGALLAGHATYAYRKPSMIYISAACGMLAQYELLTHFVDATSFSATLIASTLISALISYLVLMYTKNNGSLKMPLAVSIVTFVSVALLYSLPNQVHLVLPSLIITLLSLSVVKEFSKYEWSILATIFGIITIYNSINLWIPEALQNQLTLIAMLTVTGVLYLGVLEKHNDKNQQQILIINLLLTCLTAEYTAIFSSLYFALANASIAILVFHASITFKKSELLYLFSTLLFITSYSFALYINLDTKLYPILFSLNAIMVYMLHLVVDESLSKSLRYTGLGMAIIVPVIYRFFSINEYQLGYLGNTALYSGYFATILFGFDAYRVNTTTMKYTASAIALVTYLWQIQELGITERQIYTLPIGIYFMVLGYFEKLKARLDNHQALDTLGLAFIIVPTILQTFGVDGIYYTLLALIEGFFILAVGVSIKYKKYIYAGTGTLISAALIKTYEYVFLLPWWLVTALIGGGFLALALFLMLRKKE